MRKVIIFGNSASGKSSLAKKLKQQLGLAHLDLDTLAWLPVTPPKRRPLEQVHNKIQDFIAENSGQGWLIEGCYTDLLELIVTDANEAIFMNLPVDLCIENAKCRPWEPHKYASKIEQDKNLSLLLDWISLYEDRLDTFSLQSHQDLYDQFSGSKKMYTDNCRE